MSEKSNENKGSSGSSKSNNSGQQRDNKPVGLNKGNVPRMENPPKPPKKS